MLFVGQHLTPTPALVLSPCWLTQVVPAVVQVAVVLQTQQPSCAAYRVLALAVLAAWPACWVAWVAWAAAWVLAGSLAWLR
jgi:hypothetical protein